MHQATEFAQLVKTQMGVEVFILAGWKDEDGQTKKAK
jgi:hypothetical protein